MSFFLRASSALRVKTFFVVFAFSFSLFTYFYRSGEAKLIEQAGPFGCKDTVGCSVLYFKPDFGIIIALEFGSGVNIPNFKSGQ